MIKKAMILLIFPLLLSAKTLTFAAIEFPPYVYFEDNKVKGFNVEILNEIFKRMDINIYYKKLPWARSMIMLQKGEVDALFPMLKNKSREKFVDFTHSFTSEPFALIVHKDSNISYNGNLSLLSSYTFGRVRGYSSGINFDEAVKDKIVTLDESIDSQQNISKFFKRRFDILVDNQFYIIHAMKKLRKEKEVRILTPLLSNTKAYLGFSKQNNHKALIQRFNAILKEIKEDGTYDTIIKKYFD